MNTTTVLHPKYFEQKIGFDNVRLSLKDLCISSLGEHHVNKICFSNNFEHISKLLVQIEEFKQIILSTENFPTNHFYDINCELEKITVSGTFLETDVLFDMKRSLNTVSEIITYFKKNGGDSYPFLKKLSSYITIDSSIISELKKILDDKGKIRDNASPQLSLIRQDLISKHSLVTKRIAQALSNARKQGWVPDNMDVSIRNGRMVIPILVAYKRSIKGFIHDESATGQTVFIDPADVFEINNDIRELENAERREILKILYEFTDFLRPSIDDIKNCLYFLGQIDFIRAKALYAFQTDSYKPSLNTRPLINWINARHPLLYLSHKVQKKEIVPLNISLDEVMRILVISGPNAGGKSVCLKTVGLLQYMLQCGMQVPMDEFSKTGIFSNIFIDIGDEQSLENDLSTYSSHLLNMKHFVENSDNKTLFLIDEFGAGTEPQLGGAIAEAILEKLNNKNAFGVITTHYSNLKLLADKEQGIMNGAMLFDSKNLKPLFILHTGKPGSSFAFEIAETIGLPEDVLFNAKQKAGVKQLSFDKQLQNLEVQKKELDKKELEYRIADDFLSEIINKYQKLTNDLEISKKEIIDNAKVEAAKLLQGTNRVIENTIREIKENKAEKEITKKLRNELSDYSTKLSESIISSNKPLQKVKKKKSEPQPEQIKIINTPIKKGDYVRISGQSTIGEVSGIDSKDVFVVFGTVSVKTSLDNIEKVSSTDYARQSGTKKTSYKRQSIDLTEKVKMFKSNIDLRGMRADEALSAIQHFIDDALLLNVYEVRILHGKGDGILRNLVHEYLRSINEVKQFGDESLDKGGHGITVVSFR